MSFTEILSIVGLSAVALGYGAARFFQTKEETSGTLLTYLTNENKGYAAALLDLQAQRAEDNKRNAVEMEVLRGQINTFIETVRLKDETIEKQNKIIENRNPELDQFMKQLSAAVVRADTFRDEDKEFRHKQMEMMGKIHDCMQSLTRHMDKQNNAEIKIESTVTKQ